MRLCFLIIGLLVALASCEIQEQSEPSLCLQEKDPFSYHHCIKKRDTGCQNGGFCGSCNSNSCQSCNGNNCRTTCNGNGCNQCPSGNCCNGQNCNICHGNNCCFTGDCNSCTNSCNAGCSTSACRSACLLQCQNISNNCCCNWGESDCFKSCRNNCMGDSCYQTCFAECKCEKPCPTKEPFTPNNNDKNITVVLGNNTLTNNSPVNITTIIDLKNFIYNKNEISNPINFTHVSHNYVNVSQPQPTKSPIDKCCYVVHPVHCYNINEPPYQKCVQKRHWECSDICTSVVIHLIKQSGQEQPPRVVYQEKLVRVLQPYPVKSVVIVPVIQKEPIRQPPLCYSISRPPWVACSNHYGVQSCGSCYTCGGQFNPRQCSTQVSCEALCRSGILYNDPRIAERVLKYAPYYTTKQVIG